MLSVTIKSIILNVIMLSIVMLSVIMMNVSPMILQTRLEACHYSESTLGAGLEILDLDGSG